MLAVIMAGGHGTRLWPLSTQQKPKQFQQLIGEKTLLRQTYDRLKAFKPEHIFVSTNAEFAELVAEQLPELPTENIIIEPTRRDTGPAMAFVTHVLAQKGHADQTMSIIYADHYIKETEDFNQKLKFAHELAQKHKNINIIQVKAKEPNTQLGYVKIGNLLTNEGNDGDHKVYELDCFVEKPDLELATKYANSVDYLWNTGLYTWHIDSFLNLIAQNSPAIHEVLTQINDHEHCQQASEQFPKISLDYALMEKLGKNEVMIIPADFTWSDVGSLNTIHDHLKNENDNNNVITGDTLAIDTENSIIYGQSQQKIITIGLKDMAVIVTKDNILICPKDETTKIKMALEQT
jgi:mannose-1-phosphate guanylyltransferase